MANEELCFLSACELSSLIARGEASPLEVAEAHLQRIDRWNDTLRAYLYVARDEALEAARAAQEEIAAGRYRGPLHGIPVAYKDIYDVQGMPTTAHSHVMDGYVAPADCTVAARLRSAGTITLGKVNTHEFASGGMEFFGQARNPWDTNRVPGASSSGSAAALAARLIPLATGSDTGGSIRNPASFCGIAGLKPTYGRVSRAGILPVSWSLDHAGPMARTVADAALMLQAMAGPDPRDPTAVEQEVPDYRAALKADLRGVRLGVPSNYFFESADAEVEQAVRSAISAMRGLGATVKEVSIPHVSLGMAASWVVSFTETYAYHRANFFRRTRDYGRSYVRKISVAAFFSAEERVTAQRIREMVTREFMAALADVDAIVTPVSPYPAFPIDQHMARQADVGLYSRPVSITGLPALSIPAGFTESGLPIGVQIVGRPWGEATVLGIGHAYEQSAGWHLRRAPLRPGPVEPESAEEGYSARVQPSPTIDAQWVMSHARLAGLSYIEEIDAGPIAALLGPLKETLAAAREHIPADLEPPTRPAPRG